jgi:hypothetical protein
MAAGGAPKLRRTRRWPLVLLIAPFIGLLYPAWYTHERPHLWGFPFFYWYQFAWVLVTAALTGVVYLLTYESDVSAEDIDPESPGTPTPPGAVS